VAVTTHYLDEAERLCDRVAISKQEVSSALDRQAPARRARRPELELPRSTPIRSPRSRAAQQGVAGDDSFAVGADADDPGAGRSVDAGSPTMQIGLQRPDGTPTNQRSTTIYLRTSRATPRRVG